MTSLTPQAAALLPRRPVHPRYPITRRQLEALRLAANGRSNAQIARELGVSKSTVDGLLWKIYRKLAAADRAQAVAVAIRLGLIALEDIRLPDGLKESA